jgi:ribosomal protein L11 methyltransferase
MPAKKYVNVALSIFEEDYEVAYSILTDYDFLGMEEKLDEIVLSFEEKNWNDAIRKELENQIVEKLPQAKITKIEVLTERNWNEEWEKNVEPVRVSDRIVITPEWKLSDFDCETRIVINPKMSFGTGQHSTTLLMAQAVEKYFQTNPLAASGLWVDAGTGTGVLAIEAAMLGASRVWAFDNDDWSYDNALENTERNGVVDKVEVTQCGIDVFNFPQVHCITANMYIGLILASFPKFHSALEKEDGVLFVSGILQFDKDELVAGAENNGFVLAEETNAQEWCCFKFELKKEI